MIQNNFKHAGAMFVHATALVKYCFHANSPNMPLPCIFIYVIALHPLLLLWSITQSFFFDLSEVCLKEGINYLHRSDCAVRKNT